MTKVSPEERKAFYKSKSWERTRQLVLARDSYECQRCKELGLIHLDSKKQEGFDKTIELNIHHIKPLEEYPELAHDLDNLVSLCLFHHNEIEGKLDNFLKHSFRKKEKRWDDEKW